MLFRVLLYDIIYVREKGEIVLNKELLELKKYLLSKGIKEDELTPYLDTINKNMKNKKYGLVWEEQEENIIDELRGKFPVLKEIKEKEIITDANKPMNLLIEGDNLESLYALNYTHKEEVDVIYIDPPYNTGNKDFIYNDKMIGLDDEWRHSKWLSFMNKRLRLAKELLKDDGVIFISIDDNEMAQLKLLCDEIFGEENFIANIAVEISKTQGMKVRSAQQGQIVKNHEYVLVYIKNINNNIDRKPLYDRAEPYDTHFDIILDKDDKMIPLIQYLKVNKEISSMFKKYSFAVSKANISKLMELDASFNEYMLYDIAPILYRKSMISSREIQALDIGEGQIVRYKDYILTKNSKGTIEQLQSFLNTLQITDEYKTEYQRATIRGALWKGFYSDMMNIAKEGNMAFKNGKKPIRLIKQLIKWANREDAVILDFFAGSGSTGHSVLDLNKEDGGKRKFILCTNNENNICEEITYKRLYNVIKGYGNYPGIGGNLAYYKTNLTEDRIDSHENISNLIDKCTPIIQIKENCYHLSESSDVYDIISNDKKTAIVIKNPFIWDYEIDEILEIYDGKTNGELIIYTTKSDYKKDGVTTKEFPQHIVDLYNRLRKTM